ncbi:DUF6199 family natural product biosynthesis protein [Gottfriedia acidiceleris]|uniref:DUF6199 family natural product biosynthesis protein n=1 Tax=Gottfriedia acidiceleris TaxID=371036 RepID=UPI000B436288|nr:DUF6199 family natural product biosynthesis protein [Gottfriedia acidiceleris]
MLFLGILLLIIGLLMLISPYTFYLITESWKSHYVTEPSSLYVWSTRFGGIMFTLVGSGEIISSFI